MLWWTEHRSLHQCTVLQVLLSPRIVLLVAFMMFFEDDEKWQESSERGRTEKAGKPRLKILAGQGQAVVGVPRTRARGGALIASFLQHQNWSPS